MVATGKKGNQVTFLMFRLLYNGSSLAVKGKHRTLGKQAMAKAATSVAYTPVRNNSEASDGNNKRTNERFTTCQALSQAFSTWFLIFAVTYKMFAFIIPISLMENWSTRDQTIESDSRECTLKSNVKILICIISDPKHLLPTGFILVLRAAGRSPSVHSSGKEN